MPKSTKSPDDLSALMGTAETVIRSEVEPVIMNAIRLKVVADTLIEERSKSKSEPRPGRPCYNHSWVMAQIDQFKIPPAVAGINPYLDALEESVNALEQLPKERAAMQKRNCSHASGVSANTRERFPGAMASQLKRLGELERRLDALRFNA